MINSMNIKNENFIAIIQRPPGAESIDDPLEKGRYPVWVPELMLTHKEIDIIWVQHYSTGNQYNLYKNPNDENESSGSYYPLKEGMKVVISFLDDHMLSGYIKYTISGTDRNRVPLEEGNKENFYLQTKTTNETWEYIHDGEDLQQLKHLLHGKGRTNFALEGDVNSKVARITLQVSHPLNGGVQGVKPKSTIEMTDKHIVLEMANKHRIIMNDGGIEITAFQGDHSIFLNAGGIRMDTIKNVLIQAQKNVDISAQEELKMSGKIETHVKSDVLRLTGNKQMSASGNVINVQSATQTYVGSGLNTRIASDVKLTTTAPLIENKSLGMMTNDSMLIVNKGQLITNESSMISSNSPVIANDTLQLNSMGIASSISPSVYGGASATNIVADATAAIVTTTMGGFNDPGTSVASSAVVEGMCPARAKGPDEMRQRTFDKTNFGQHISPKVSKIIKGSNNDKKQAVKELQECLNPDVDYN